MKRLTIVFLLSGAMTSNLSFAQVGPMIQQINSSFYGPAMQAGADLAAGVIPHGIENPYSQPKYDPQGHTSPTAEQIATEMRRQEYSKRADRVREDLFKQYNREFNK